MRSTLAHLTLGKRLGVGSYSVVFEVYCSKTGRAQALKVLDSLFDDSEDARRLLRELRAVTQLRHPNIVKFLGIVAPTNPIAYRSCALLFEKYETTLSDVLNGHQVLIAQHVQYFMFQLMHALMFIHESGVIHGDVKPANLLLNTNCHLALCDFNLARTVRMWELELIQTSWYRAPEVIIGEVLPGPPIDIWSAGCIFAELLRATESDSAGALFPVDDRPHKQLRAIAMALVTVPSLDGLPVASRTMRESLQRAFAAREKGRSLYTIQDEFAEFGPACDLLIRMLDFTAARRPTAREVLADSYFDSLPSRYRKQLQVPEATSQIDMSDIDHIAVMSEPCIRAGLNKYLETHPAPELRRGADSGPAPDALECCYKRLPSSASVGAASPSVTP